MLLELKKVVKSFGGLMVLSQIDFHIEEGEIIGLIGPNGAGKTTLFNVITGIYRPEEGAIPKENLFELKHFLETTIMKKRESSWTYLFEKFGLIPSF